MKLEINKILMALVVTCFLFTGETTQSQEPITNSPRLDTNGKFINAHGGGVLFHQGVYYWYGECKTGRPYLPDCNKAWGGTRVDITGVSCYSSTNLQDWRNEGIVLAAVSDDTNSDLHPSKVLKRPKVIYNRVTKKFVMWMHIDSADYALARSGVAISDTPTGKFLYMGSFRPDAGFWPVDVKDADKIPGENNFLERDFKNGQMARDQTVFMDDDGRAYLFYSSEENSTMHVSLLTDDYLHTSGKYRRVFIDRSMEAPAVFRHNGKYYFIGSGCTGWQPNAARSAFADNPLGPWVEWGNPCVGPNATNTFQAQSTFVLPVAGRPGQYIAMFDRWKQWDLPASTYLWLMVKFEADGKLNVRCDD